MVLKAYLDGHWYHFDGQTQYAPDRPGRSHRPFWSAMRAAVRIPIPFGQNVLAGAFRSSRDEWEWIDPPCPDRFRPDTLRRCDSDDGNGGSDKKWRRRIAVWRQTMRISHPFDDA